MKTGAVNGDKKMIRPGHTSASKLTRALHVFMVFLTSVSMLPGTVPALQAQQIIIDPSRPVGPVAIIRRGEGAEDPDPDLPASQITGAQSGREGLAISSGERAPQPPP